MSGRTEPAGPTGAPAAATEAPAAATEAGEATDAPATEPAATEAPATEPAATEAPATEPAEATDARVTERAEATASAAAAAAVAEASMTPHEDRPGRALVIVAHPDDADFGTAGTVARWVRGGTVAWLVCCTSGDAGADDAATDPLALARLREAEQRAAAEVVGYAGVTFLHRPDGALENDLALREQLVRVIREFRPDAVLSMDPTVVILDNRYVQHVDHRMAGQAALDAVYPAARNAMAFPHLALQDGLAPHSVRWLYLFFSDRPTAWVDISRTLDVKLAALRRHVSQLRKPEELEESISSWARDDGRAIGTAAAEAFRVVEIGG